MKNLYITLFLLNFVSISAQAPAIVWQKRMGGNNWNLGSNMCSTFDGGFFVAGRSSSNAIYEKTENSRGGSDYWVLKLDSNGVIEWDKTIGGAQSNGQISNENDIMGAAKQTPDGGYILCGSSDSPISGEKTESCRGYYDYWIVKLNNMGTIEWQRTLGGNLQDECRTIINTLDGGYMLAGFSYSNISGDKTEDSRGLADIWLVKLNATGSIEWQKTIGGNSYENIGINGIIQNLDGTYVIATGSSSDISGEKTENSRGSSDIWLLKLDSSGNILLQKTIGGSGEDQSIGIIATNDGNYLINGTSKSPISGEKTDYCRGGTDGWFLKVDASFTIIWQKTYGGNSDDYFTGYQCNDNGFIVSGGSLSGVSGEKITPVSGYTDAWILKLSETGNIQWQKTIGGYSPGIYGGLDGLASIIQLLDSSFVLFGGTNSDISGDIVDFPRGNTDYWLVKLAPENLSTTGFTTSNVQVYPNPTTKMVSINFPQQFKKLAVTVVTILGQIVHEQTFTNLSKINLDINGAKGIYFVNVVNENNEKLVFKVIKE